MTSNKLILDRLCNITSRSHHSKLSLLYSHVVVKHITTRCHQCHVTLIKVIKIKGYHVGDEKMPMALDLSLGGSTIL